MFFFLHLLGLLYGAFGLVWTRIICTPGKVLLPAPVLAGVVSLYPPSLFSPAWKESGEIGADQEPNGTKPYLISGALFAYCLRYLFTRCRG